MKEEITNRVEIHRHELLGLQSIQPKLRYEIASLSTYTPFDSVVVKKIILYIYTPAGLKIVRVLIALK